MSGSKSSAHDALVRPEPVEFTVYHVDGPDLAEGQQRTRSGRVKMLLVLAICAAPVLLSYLAYFVVRPEGRNNYGTLIQPTRSLPAVALRDLDGHVVPAATLKGQWLLVVAGPSECNAGCERLLHAQRQLREMLGHDRDRVDKVWFVADDGPLRAPLRLALAAQPAVTVLRFPAATMTQWLSPEPGRQLQDHLYLIDPMGEWMMRFPVEFDPGKVKRDLERLLRASASWDRAGR